MGGLSGILPNGLALPLPQGGAPGIQSGATYLAQVVTHGSGLALEVQGAKLPLPPNAFPANVNQAAAQLAGTQVRVRITQSPEGLVLRFLSPSTEGAAAGPQSGAPPTAPHSTQGANAALLGAASKAPIQNAPLPNVASSSASAQAPTQSLQASSPEAALLRAISGALATAKIAKTPSATAPLVPRQTPPNVAVVGNLLALFSADQGAGEDLAQVAATLRQAVQAQALPQSAAPQGFLAALATQAQFEGDGLINIIRRWQEHATRTTEAKILRVLRDAPEQLNLPRTAAQQAPPQQPQAPPGQQAAVGRGGQALPQQAAPPGTSEPGALPAEQGRPAASGSGGDVPRPAQALATALGRDLREQIGRLLDNASFQRHLDESGQAETFRQAADRVVQRLIATQTQNLHGLELPYQYLELPMAPDVGIQRAQIHVFGEGSGRQQPGQRGTTIAFDLETEALGKLWINLAAFQEHCTCTVQATQPAAADLLAQHGDELAEGLKRAGFRSASVQTAPWDGDRFEATVRLFQPFVKFDTQA